MVGTPISPDPDADVGYTGTRHNKVLASDLTVVHQDTKLAKDG